MTKGPETRKMGVGWVRIDENRHAVVGVWYSAVIEPSDAWRLAGSLMALGNRCAWLNGVGWLKSFMDRQTAFAEGGKAAGRLKEMNNDGRFNITGKPHTYD